MKKIRRIKWWVSDLWNYRILRKPHPIGTMFDAVLMLGTLGVLVKHPKVVEHLSAETTKALEFLLNTEVKK